jgi:hypothetical protein
MLKRNLSTSPTTSSGEGEAWRFCGGYHSKTRDFLLKDHETLRIFSMLIVCNYPKGEVANNSSFILSLFGATFYISPQKQASGGFWHIGNKIKSVL